MSFLGLSARGLLTGFAGQQVESAKQARTEIMDSVKNTLNYRAKLAVENKAKKNAELKTAVTLGKSLMDYDVGFSVGMIGLLQSNGQLEKVAALYEKARLNNYKLPDADTVVNLANETPTDMPLEDYLRKVTIGSHVSQKTQQDLGINKPYKQKGVFGGIFDLKGSAYRDAEKYAADFSRQLGMTPSELTAYAFDGLEKTKPEGAVDIEQFAGMGSDTRVAFTRATGQIGKEVSGVMGIENPYQLTADGVYTYIGLTQQSILTDAFNAVRLGVNKEISDRLAGKDGQGAQPYADVLTSMSDKLSNKEEILDYFLSLPAEDRVDRNKNPIDVDALRNTLTGSTSKTQGATGGTTILDAAIRTKLANAKNTTGTAFTKAINDIIADVKTKTGGRSVANTIRTIITKGTQNGKSPADVIDEVLQLTVSNIIPTDDTRKQMTASNLDTAAKESDNPEIIASAKKLEDVGVDTTDVSAVNAHLTQVANQNMGPLQEQYDGTQEDLEKDIIASVEEHARAITGHAIATRGVA